MVLTTAPVLAKARDAMARTNQAAVRRPFAVMVCAALRSGKLSELRPQAGAVLATKSFLDNLQTLLCTGVRDYCRGQVSSIMCTQDSQ